MKLILIFVLQLSWAQAQLTQINSVTNASSSISYSNLPSARQGDGKKPQFEKPIQWKSNGNWESSPQVKEWVKKSRTYRIETKSDGGVDLGGGVVIEINKRAALRDLVDNTVCEWMPGSEFQVKFAPGAQDAIERIKTHHWYLGDAYEREAANSLVCLTAGPLKKIPDQDLDAVTIFSRETKQVAIRAGRMIFIDMSIFSNMINQNHRDFLWIHELTHSFIPFDLQDVKRRNDSLRSFVRALSNDFDSNRIAVNIEANQLNVPSTTAELDYYKNEILSVFNQKVPVSKRAQIATQLGKTISNKLWITDRRQLKEITNQYVEVSEQIWRAILQEDLRMIHHLYSLHGLSTSDPLFVAFANQCYYYPTGLQIALHRCGSQPPDLRYQPKVVSYFLKQMNHKPSVEEVKFFVTKTLRQTPKYFMWVVLFEKNPQYDLTVRTVDEIATQIPTEKMSEFLNDDVIRTSDLMVESIKRYSHKH